MKLTYKNLNVEVIEDKNSLLDDQVLSYVTLKDLYNAYKKAYGESIVSSFIGDGCLKMSNQEEITEFLSNLQVDLYEDDDLDLTMEHYFKTNPDETICLTDELNIINLLGMMSNNSFSDGKSYNVILQGGHFWCIKVYKKIKLAKDDYEFSGAPWDIEAGYIQKTYDTMKILGLSHRFNKELLKVIEDNYVEEFNRPLEIKLIEKSYE